ncbi:MAG: TVP38/TMEM64 family protein [Acidobacteriota bacterium]
MKEMNPVPDEGKSRISTKSRLKPWLSLFGLLLIVLVGLAVWRWGGPLIEILKDQERIRSWLYGFGPWAPLVSIGLNAAQVLLAPIPGQVLGLANGYLFGLFWGTLYSMAGLILGSALAMGLGRWLGRPAVVHLAGSENLDRLDALANRRGPLFFFLIFLLPLVPDDIACFAVGLSSLSIPFILFLAAIGRLPGMIVSSWIGAHAGGLSPLGWALVTGGTLALGIVVLRFQKKIEAGILRFVNRLSGNREGSDKRQVEKKD